MKNSCKGKVAQFYDVITSEMTFVIRDNAVDVLAWVIQSSHCRLWTAHRVNQFHPIGNVGFVKVWTPLINDKLKIFAIVDRQFENEKLTKVLLKFW